MTNLSSRARQAMKVVYGAGDIPAKKQIREDLKAGKFSLIKQVGEKTLRELAKYAGLKYKKVMSQDEAYKKFGPKVSYYQTQPKRLQIVEVEPQNEGLQDSEKIKIALWYIDKIGDLEEARTVFEAASSAIMKL